MLPVDHTRLTVTCDLSEYALEDTIPQVCNLPPELDLYVPAILVDVAHRILSHRNAVGTYPIRIHIDETLGQNDWYLIGPKGCKLSSWSY